MCDAIHYCAMKSKLTLNLKITFGVFSLYKKSLGTLWKSVNSVTWLQKRALLRLFRESLHGLEPCFPQAAPKSLPKALKFFGRVKIWDSSMKEKTVMVLRKHSPPLSEANIDEITEAIMAQVAAEQKKKEGMQAARLRSVVQPLRCLFHRVLRRGICLKFSSFQFL